MNINGVFLFNFIIVFIIYFKIKNLIFISILSNTSIIIHYKYVFDSLLIIE